MLAVGCVLLLTGGVLFVWAWRSEASREQLDSDLRRSDRPHVEAEGIDPNATATIARSGMMGGTASFLLRDGMQSTLAGRRTRRWPVLVLGALLVALGLWGGSSFFVVVGGLVVVGSIGWMIWSRYQGRSRLI